MSPTPVPAALAQSQFPEEILDVLRRLQGAGHKAYLVGGLVRDRLLGRPGGDYDVATSARAEQVMRLFRKVIPTGIQHGTVTVLTRSDKVEVTTFRGEGAYEDGRRPESVVFLDNVVEDLARRDFTINAMAYDPIRAEFVDPFGGAGDLALRRVRCVGRARERFSEDGLRPLRAVRFASVLDFDIDPETFAAIPATLGTFAKIALERVREEVQKTLVGPHPAKGLRLLQETGLLAPILPELLEGEAAGAGRFERTLARLEACPREVELRHAALLWDVPPAAAALALERLRHPRATIDAVRALLVEKGFALRRYPDDAALRRALSRAGRKLVPGLLALGAAEARGDAAAEEIVREVEAATARVLAEKPALSFGELALDGKAVMRILGSGQGPLVGQALRFLLDQVLEDPTRNTAPSLEALLGSWKGR